MPSRLQLFKKFFLFTPQFRGNQNSNGLSNDFLLRIPENTLGTSIPTGDDCVQILANDRILSGFDDSNMPEPGIFARFRSVMSRRTPCSRPSVNWRPTSSPTKIDPSLRLIRHSFRITCPVASRWNCSANLGSSSGAKTSGIVMFFEFVQRIAEHLASSLVSIQVVSPRIGYENAIQYLFRKPAIAFFGSPQLNLQIMVIC